jgi:hypothetical protein
MKPKIGDVFEIRTQKGLAYGMFTHYKQGYGAVIRIFDRVYPSRPASIAEILKNAVQFTTFFPLSAAVSQELFEVVGNSEVPGELEDFPVFRTGMRNPLNSHIESWSLWDGERSLKVGKLTRDQYRLPIRSIWNDSILINRVENGWRPENDKIDGLPETCK